jgi:type IV secretion system protein TrbC
MHDYRRLLILPVSWGLSILESVSSIAEAAPTGPAMPWDGPLNTILTSLSGTVAHVLITVAVIVTGLVFAFTEHGSGARRLFGVAFGGAIALGALSFMTAVGWAGATF